MVSLFNISQESQTDSWEMLNVVLFDPQKPLKDHGFVFFFYVRKKQFYWLCLANDLWGITNQRCREQVWAARCRPARGGGGSKVIWQHGRDFHY